MAGERAGLMATDPPYLVDYDGGNHPQTWANGGKQAGRDVATKHWDAYTDHDSCGRLLRGASWPLPWRGASPSGRSSTSGSP